MRTKSFHSTNKIRSSNFGLPTFRITVFFIFTILLLGFGKSSIAQFSQPNIIFILADDWGWTDWQMNGNEYGSTFYETPNLNKLANDGIVFTQAYATPLCSPSRAALLTGKFPGARFHMHQAITGASVQEPVLPSVLSATQKTCFPESRNHLPLEEITIAEELQKAGYSTHQFGKWHLGSESYFPVHQGFDTQFAVGGAGPGRGGYFAPYQGLSNIQQGKNGEYITERLTGEVIQKMTEVKDKPFFIYMAHYNVHSPYEAKAQLIQKYENKSVNNSGNKHRHPIMAAMIESLDESVGKVLDKVKELGIEDNTIVVLMGDNGGIAWENDKRSKFKNTPITSNAPLRAGKACFYEGGVRVPLLIKYPNRIAAGRIENTPVHLVDFYPTLIEWANSTISSEKDAVDGVSLVSLLENKTALKERPLFCHFPRKKQVGAAVGGSFVRIGDYKLCRLYGLNHDASDKYELYNLKNDISETKDLSAEFPDVTKALKHVLNNWLEETGALVPHSNPNWQIK
jgi:arylsulfatase A-like enzyme